MLIFFFFQIQHLVPANGSIVGETIIDSGAISGQGLVGHLLTGVTDGAKKLICSNLGTNFLYLLSGHSQCTKIVASRGPNAFKSLKSFCKFYEKADKKTQKCLSTASIDVNINLHGIGAGRLRIGECCKRRAVSIWFT